MSEEEKKRKLLEMWEKEQLANECVRQYLQYRKTKEYLEYLEDKIDKAIEYINDIPALLWNEAHEFDYDFEKLLEILVDKEQEEYTLTKDENGTTQINGEWYRVEKK